MAGELLLGFELCAGALEAPPPSLRPPMQAVRLQVFVVGGRNLADQEGVTSRVKRSTVEYEMNEHRGETDWVAGTNPTYLSDKGPDARWQDGVEVELPEDALYAPALTFRVFHDTLLDDRKLLGSADLDLREKMHQMRQDQHEATAAAAAAAAATRGADHVVVDVGADAGGSSRRSHTSSSSSSSSTKRQPGPPSSSERRQLGGADRRRRRRRQGEYAELDDDDEKGGSDDDTSEESESDSGSSSAWDSDESDSDTDGSSLDTVVEETSVPDTGPRPVFGLQRGTAKWRRFASVASAARELKMPPTLEKKIATCCELASEGPLEFGGAAFDFKFAEEPAGTKVEHHPAWRIGRRRALDELENVYPAIKRFSKLSLRSPKQGAAPAGKLKVMVQLTPLDDDRNDGNAGGGGSGARGGMALRRNQSTPIGGHGSRSSRGGSTAGVPATAVVAGASQMLRIQSTQVYVRLYVIRGFRLVAKDAGNSSDPFVIATIDGKPGVWPKGAPLSGVVAQTSVPNTLEPYFGLVYEWRGVTLPGAGELLIEVRDDDGPLRGSDLIGATVIDLEDRFFSEEWRQLGCTATTGQQHRHRQQIIRKPIEQRDLFMGLESVGRGGGGGGGGITQGVLA